MLQPKRRKYIKDVRGRRRGKAQRGSYVSFGDYGLKSLGVAWVTAAQIEAGRRAITHALKRGGKVWVRIFPDKPVSGRSAGKRMGGGKGDVVRHVAVVKPGRVLYEVAGIDFNLVKDAFYKAGQKMPVKTMIVSK